MKTNLIQNASQRLAALKGEERSGIAIVELAICLPVILIIVFGTIETANLVFLKQVLTEIAYEGALVVTAEDGTNAAAIARCQTLIVARKLLGTSVTITPNVTPTTPIGTPVTVVVQASASSNAISPQWFFKSFILKADVVMSKL